MATVDTLFGPTGNLDAIPLADRGRMGAPFEGISGAMYREPTTGEIITPAGGWNGSPTGGFFSYGGDGVATPWSPSGALLDDPAWSAWNTKATDAGKAWAATQDWSRGGGGGGLFSNFFGDLLDFAPVALTMIGAGMGANALMTGNAFTAAPALGAETAMSAAGSGTTLANAGGGPFWGDVSLSGAPSGTSLTTPSTFNLLNPTQGASTFGNVGTTLSTLANDTNPTFWGNPSLAGTPSSTSLITDPATFNLLDPTAGAGSFGTLSNLGSGVGAGAGAGLATPSVPNVAGAAIPAAAAGAGGAGGAPVVELGKPFAGFGTGNGVFSDLSSIAGSALGGGAAALGGWPNLISNGLSIGSGIYGLMEARKLRKLGELAGAGTDTPGTVGNSLIEQGSPINIGSPGATVTPPTRAAIEMSDPFGTNQGRQSAADRLKALLDDPNSIFTMPGYEAGEQAVMRQMAAQGYLGSGNMTAALQKYGGSFYNDQVQQLAKLAVPDATRANLLLSGDQMGLNSQIAGIEANLKQRGLSDNSIRTQMTAEQGYLDAASRALASIGYGANGGGAQFTPQMREALRRAGIVL